MQDDLSRLPQSPAGKPQHSSPRVRATVQLTTSTRLPHYHALFPVVRHANASHACARAPLGRDLCPWWQVHVVATCMNMKIVIRTFLQAAPLELARAMKYRILSVLHAGEPERGVCAHRTRLLHLQPKHQRSWRQPAQQPPQSRRPIPQPPRMVGIAVSKPLRADRCHLGSRGHLLTFMKCHQCASSCRSHGSHSGCPALVALTMPAVHVA